MTTSSSATVPSPSSVDASSNNNNKKPNTAGPADSNNDNNNNNNPRSLARLRSTKSTPPPPWKTAPSHSCISRPSSLSSKSRASQGSSTAKPHAYFASSEEESEAELDEKDSHSSRDNTHATNYGSHSQSSSKSQQHPRVSLGKSNLRGSKKLAEIASKVGHHASLHSSRVRMTIPQNHNHPDHAITTPSSSAGGGGRNKDISKMPPPQTVTVAPISATILPPNSSSSSSLPHNHPTQPASASTLRSNNNRSSSASASALSATSATAALHHVNNNSPYNTTNTSSSSQQQQHQQQQPLNPLPSSSTHKRNSRSKKKSRLSNINNNDSNNNNNNTNNAAKQPTSRHHKHLPRGLPVFLDPRSCMWTSTYDANAPSEDRYSSLVNVLLRPPKTPRGGGGGGSIGGSMKKENDNKNATANNNGNGNTITNNNSNGDGGGGGGGGGNSSSQQQPCGGRGCDGGSSDEEGNGTTVEQRGSTSQSSPHSASTANNKHNINHNHSNTTPSPSTDDDEDNTSLIRLSLWSVIDGHGGGCVATYGAEVLLPHIAASVARALKSEIVDRGVCNVNGQLRDANALDLDGLIRSSDRSRHVGKSQVRQREAGIDVVNPNSIHYRSPYEDSESEGDVGVDHASRGTQDHDHRAGVGVGRGGPGGGGGGGGPHSDEGDTGMRSEFESEAESEAPVSVASSLLPGNPITHMESVSSVKTSVKTAVSPVTQHAPVGTHSPAEVASITRAITDSFLAVDEGWINSIDPVTTHQTSCVSNGRWNAGACALVVFIVQRLDWCRSSRVDHETHHRERGEQGFDDTSHNKDAARRRKLDYATKSKSVSSLSTLSSTSSITTEANTTEMLVEESEITETEDDDDVSDIFGHGRRRRKKIGHHHDIDDDDPHHREGVFIATPAGCKCHYYRPHDAMLYTAHVGDCRAVMLGSAPPRTIKVPPEGDSSLSLDHASLDDESSSESIADELSSSEGHDSDSSGDMMEDEDHFMRSMGRSGGRRTRSSSAGGGAAGMLGYVRRASKRQRRNEQNVIEQPFVPLPPLNRRDSSSEESAVESDDSTSTTAQEHLLPVGSIVRTVPARGGVLGGVADRVAVGVDVKHNRNRGVPPVFNNLEVADKLLETEDEEAEEDEIKEIRSVRSGSPTQMDRPPSPTQLVADPVHPPPLPLSMLMRPIDLTTDHSAYNPAEVTAVLRRCNNAPKAISSASSGGIKRVAGSLAVTRALGDAYLKTPRLSFFPYKRHAPYITARPEVNCRVLTKGADRILTLASDGVWERASGDDVLRWVRNYYNARIAGVEEQHLHGIYESMMLDRDEQLDPYVLAEAAAHQEKSIRRNKHESRLKSNIEGGDNSDGALVGNSSGGEISSEDGTATGEEKTEDLTPPVDNTAVKKPPGGSATSAATAAAAASGDEKVEDSDAATTSETTAATTTAHETTATSAAATKAGTKRKHASSNSAVADDSASSRSASTIGSSRGGRGRGGVVGVGTAMSHSAHHHLRSSSRPYSLAIPTVSEVIVRKVLNKVRKTRNISSLRMLMSLPKGRARRSKHDDITATVVDLSGFVS
ncbi:hypothetical protein ACHAXR_011527 [Thalassiosira sp. AJA248-18]